MDPILPPSQDDTAQFWNSFPNSRAQRVLIFEVERMIEAGRGALETATQEEVTREQANIFAFRKLLNILRRKESPR